MRLRLMDFGALAATLMASGLVAAQSTPYYEPGMSAGNQRQGPTGIGQDVTIPKRFDWRDDDQARRWVRVGRCVARQDRRTSVTYLTSARGSAIAKSSYRRLDPVFDHCFRGSGAVSRGVAEYRRAALADALRITPNGG
jgi:hypothetical protein